MWCRERGSNPRPSVYKTAALPLSYPGKFGDGLPPSANQSAARRFGFLPLSFRLSGLTDPQNASRRCKSVLVYWACLPFESRLVVLPIRAKLVRVAGFEPAASCTQSTRATKLRYTRIEERCGDPTFAHAPEPVGQTTKC